VRTVSAAGSRLLGQRLSSERGLQLWDLLAVVLSMAVFLALACPQLDLPGLHYDEAKEAGTNALELLRGLPVKAFRNSAVRVGDTLLPLMVQDYIGSLNVYFALPFLALFGIEVWALRLLPITLALGTLALTYALARYAAGRRTAFASTLLLAVSPSFVFWSRQGIFVTNITATLAVASSLTALRWWRERRPRHLYWTALLWGLGLYAKLLFVWIIGASVVLLGVGSIWRRFIPAGALDLQHSADREGSPTQPWRLASRVGAAVMLFILPLTPLVLFNAGTAGTLRALTDNLSSSYYGVSNAAVFSNLMIRLSQVLTVLRGGHFWYLGAQQVNPVATWIALALVVTTIVLLVTRSAVWSRLHAAQDLQSALLLIAFSGLIVAQSVFTVSDLFITHFAMLLPFIYLSVGALMGFLSHHGGRVLTVTLVIGCAVWISWDVHADLRYHAALARTGGHASHSDAVTLLAVHLESTAIVEPIAMDWGIAAPVTFLTQANVRPLEVFGYADLETPGVDFDQQIRKAMEDPSSVYVFHVPEEEVFHGRRERFDELLSDAGMMSVIDEVIHERSGRMLYVVARVQPAESPRVR